MNMGKIRRALLPLLGLDSPYEISEERKKGFQREIRALDSQEEVVEYLWDCVENAQIKFQRELEISAEESDSEDDQAPLSTQDQE